jgi:hypothetical protein
MEARWEVCKIGSPEQTAPKPKRGHPLLMQKMTALGIYDIIDFNLINCSAVQYKPPVFRYQTAGNQCPTKWHA